MKPLKALIILAITMGGCATGADVRPYNGGGIELVSERLGWEGPPAPPSLATGFQPPVGSIDFLGPDIQIRVGVRNGRSYPLSFTLTCGETDVAGHEVVVVVDAESERGLYFSMLKRVGPQQFECRIKSITSIIGGS